MINILLLFSSSFLQARYRANSKRRFSMPTQSFIPSISFNDNNNNNNNNIYADNDDTQGTNDDKYLIDTIKDVPTPSTTLSPFQANEQQIEQFTRLLIERLNLKEAPNVTVNVNDETGFPSSIFKKLEQETKDQQRVVDMKADKIHRQQKFHDEGAPTAERAILPGDYMLHHTCQRQIAAKLNLDASHLHNIDCFRFMKSSKEWKGGLPTNQYINELRLYVRRNYFNFNEQHDQITPDMFQIYQVFRPTSNDTTYNPPNGFKDTIRLTISNVKELNDHWFELTIQPVSHDTDIQQIYKQLIMPWYAIAIDRDLQSSSSSLTEPIKNLNQHYHRQYHTKKHISYSLRADDEDENSKETQQQLPYMLVEYGDKFFPSSSGRRGTRETPARPARGCNPSSPCCRRSLTIDLDQANNALNFVIYPRQLDIGECVGLCGVSGSSLKHIDVKNAQHKNEHNSAYNLLLLQNGLHANRNSTIQDSLSERHSTQCCSYSRTSSLEIMYTTTNGGPIIRKLIPNMVVEECKCGLPATIQQVETN